MHLYFLCDDFVLYSNGTSRLPSACLSYELEFGVTSLQFAVAENQVVQF